MLRLLVVLLGSLWLAMYFADEIGGPDIALDQAEPGSDTPLTKRDFDPAEVILAALDAPVARSSQRRNRPSGTVDMVPFNRPVVIGPEGQKIAEDPAAFVVASATEAPETEVIPDIPVLFVTASRVNVRNGPSTADPVIGGVEFADAVQILSDPGEPWVRIRVEGDGVEGFMASKFLAPTQP